MAGGTLNDPETYNDSIGGNTLPDQDRLQNQSQNSGGINGSPAEGVGTTPVSLSTCVEALNTTWGTLGVIALFFGVTYGLYRQFGTSIALLGGYALLPPLTLGYFALTSCASAGNNEQETIRTIPINGSQGLVNPRAAPEWVIAAIFGVVMVAGLVVLWRAAGEREFETMVESAGGEGMEAADLAEAARRAADRIEKHNADVNNAVYRAWAEMTGMLDVASPDTMTSGEFAEEAIATGMARDDVEALTELFDEVRYGGIEPTEEHEQRAIDVLRNIEAEYAEQTDDAIDTTTGDGTDTDDGTDDHEGDA